MEEKKRNRLGEKTVTPLPPDFLLIVLFSLPALASSLQCELPAQLCLKCRQYSYALQLLDEPITSVIEVHGKKERALASMLGK